jgi:DNA-binding beta-propeller fold protein YncE
MTAPRAVHVGPENEIYVLDDSGRVIVLGDNGVVLRQWRMPDNSIGNPEGICLLADGRIVVADTHYDQLVFFTRTGEVLEVLGKHGTEPGQFVYPVAVCQDADGFIYVAEYGDHQRVQKFTADGKFVLQFGKQGTGPGEFQRPSGVTWIDGEVYVVDAFNNRVHLFKDDGTFVGVLDDKGYELEYPYDVTKAPDGSLYVIEHKAGRLSHLSPTGELLGRYGSSGRKKGHFITPWGIAFRGKSRIVVADTGNRRVVEIKL